MSLDVLACKLKPVWTLAQANLFGFGLCVFNFPAVAQHSSDHPECADANSGSAMNKDGTVVGIVGDFQKLCDLFFVWVSVSDGDVEVAQPKLFCFCFFVGGSVFARLAQVEDRLDAVGFQLFEVLEFRLTAGTEVFVHTQEVSDLAGVLGHRRRECQQQNRQNVNRFVLLHFRAFWCRFVAKVRGVVR